MGQYYKAIFLSDIKNNDEIIRMCINPSSFNYVGSKLMEHSYIDNIFINFIEYLLSPKGLFYKSRILWAGDYAENEYGKDKNLFYISNDIDISNIFMSFKYYNTSDYNYIVNHTKQMYINKDNIHNYIHPLPLLLSEGNGKGGGDYYGNNKSLCGSWSRDVISLEKDIPTDFIEIICNFEE